MQKNVRKTGKMDVEIFYVASVFMSGEIILGDRKVGQYGPDRNQGHLFFCFFSRKNPIKAISVKVTLIVTDIQSIYTVASYAGIKIKLED